MNQIVIVTNEWTLNGNYTGEAKKVGRSKSDFIFEGKGKLGLINKTK